MQILEYETLIAQLKAAHVEEIQQLTEELSTMEKEYQTKLKDLEEKHELEIKQYEESIQKLREGKSLTIAGNVCCMCVCGGGLSNTHVVSASLSGTCREGCGGGWTSDSMDIFSVNKSLHES